MIFLQPATTILPLSLSLSLTHSLFLSRSNRNE